MKEIIRIFSLSLGWNREEEDVALQHSALLFYVQLQLMCNFYVFLHLCRWLWLSSICGEWHLFEMFKNERERNIKCPKNAFWKVLLIASLLKFFTLCWRQPNCGTMTLWWFSEFSEKILAYIYVQNPSYLLKMLAF